MSQPVRRATLACVVLIALSAAMVQQAFGSFSPSTSASMTFMALTLAAPGNLTGTCVLLSGAHLSWNASPRATSYQILSSASSGTETFLATTTALTYADPVSLGSHYYVVKAVVFNWLSVASNEVHPQLAGLCL